MSESVAITAIMLRRHGNSMVVEAEIDGEWVVAIKEYDPYIPDVSPPHSHIVEAAGIRTAQARQDHHP